MMMRLVRDKMKGIMRWEDLSGAKLAEYTYSDFGPD